MNQQEHPITILLKKWSAGDIHALGELAATIQNRLERMAQYRLRQESKNPVLDAATLVNEAWLRLIKWEGATWENRAQFFAATSEIMRNILVDEARRRIRQHEDFQVSLSKAYQVKEMDGKMILGVEQILALHEAMDRLAKFDKRKCKIAVMRYFADMQIDEIAMVMELSSRQVQRELSATKTWLYKLMTSKEISDNNIQ